jgi:hypothetical protein
MTDQDQKQAQAMLNAAIGQRNQAMDQCIQEQQSLIESLTARIAALEAK